MTKIKLSIFLILSIFIGIYSCSDEQISENKSNIPSEMESW